MATPTPSSRAERLARIKPAMQQQIDQKVFPGAVTLVARRGKVVHFEAHGFLDDAKTKPMAKDAMFRLASMTKPIVTVAGDDAGRAGRDEAATTRSRTGCPSSRT